MSSQKSTNGAPPENQTAFARAQNLPPITTAAKNIEQKIFTLNATGTLGKVKIDPKLLSKMNPSVAKLNPGFDFLHMRADDPRLGSLRLPKDMHLIAMKDPNCSTHSLDDLSPAPGDLIGDATDRTGAPSFVSFSTKNEQTLGDLSRSLDRNSCILGVFGNGSLDSVRLSQGTKDIASLLPPGAPTPQVFNYSELLALGQASIVNAIRNGDSPTVQVYMVGSDLSAPGLDPSVPVAVRGLPIPGNSTSVYMLPLPEGDTAGQIASVNNGIIYAVNNGATFVLVPLIDPNSILPATQYATERGAKVVMVPKNTRIPVPRQPASQ